MNIKIKHHQARALLQCYLEYGYRINHALELITVAHDLTTEDIIIIQGMDMPFVLATIDH